MRKGRKNIIIMFITICIIIWTSFAHEALAMSASNIFDGASTFLEIEEGTEMPIDEDEIKEFNGTLASIIQNIGIILLVIMVVILGIIMILATTEKKTEYIKRVVPFFVGAVIILMGTNIWKATVNKANEMWGNEVAVKTVPRRATPTPTQVQATPTQAATPTQRYIPGMINQPNISSGKKVFIGDSRTVGMKAALSNDEVSKSEWACKVSMGLKWMRETGYPSVQSSITNGSNVIILMGVNDLYNVNNYADWINNKANELKTIGAKVYFVSVNPVDDSRAVANGYTERDSNVVNFNNTIKSKFNSNVIYIDTYNKIINSFYASDGIHYDNATYRNIYQAICNVVG